MITTVLIVSLLGTTLGHNWLNSPSRAGDGSRSQKASTVKPAPASPTGDPIVQVNPGQDFQVEWVIGHNRHTYFSLISKKDIDKMQMHSTKMLDDYFNNAPADQRGPPPKKYAKYHRKANMDNVWDTPSNKGVAQPQIQNYFQRRVPASDPMHIVRDKIFKGSFRGARRNVIAPEDVYQFEYKAADQATDRWAHYKSDKYPWLISAARYLHSKHQPSRPDVALINIPNDAQFGEYVVQYIWSGYYDAIDLIVIPNIVSQPYGQEIDPDAIPPPAVFSRIDHCWYPEAKLRGTCMKMVGPDLDPQDCINECRAKTEEECNGVAVVPIKADPGVYSGFANINLTPFGEPGCNKPAANDAATHMCYALRARNGTALDFEYWATTDPEDPAFYATCYHRKKPRVGFQEQAATFDPPAWEYRGKCISCADRRKWSDVERTPHWTLTDTCIDCERREPGQFDPETLHYLNFEEGAGNKVIDLVDQKEFTLNGNAGFATDAAVGNSALKVNGVVSDYLDLGTFSVSGNKITLAAWAKFDTLDGSDPRILSKTLGDSRQDHTWALTSDEPTTGQGFFARCRMRIGTDTKELRSTEQLKTNEWKHWACIYDGSRVALYLDGKLADSEAVTGQLATSNHRVIVGANTNDKGDRTKPMDGLIDDLRILNKALTEVELADLVALKN